MVRRSRRLAAVSGFGEACLPPYKHQLQCGTNFGGLPGKRNRRRTSSEIVCPKRESSHVWRSCSVVPSAFPRQPEPEGYRLLSLSNSTDCFGLISRNRPSADRLLPSRMSFTTSGSQRRSSAICLAATFVTLGAAIEVPDSFSRSPPGITLFT